ncbi:MAG: SDR family oxidoreductase [Mycoplasmatales bacterium]
MKSNILIISNGYISKNIKKILLKKGDNVYVTGRRETYDFYLDFSGAIEKQTMTLLLDFCEKRQINSFIFACGTQEQKRIEGISVDKFQKFFDDNFIFYLNIFNGLNKFMRKNRCNLIFISSVYSEKLYEKNFLYSASRSIIEKFAIQIAIEEGVYGIKSNIVCPTFYPSPMNSIEDSNKKEKKSLKQSCLNNTPDIKELSKFIYLLTRNENLVSGQKFIIDNRICHDY